MDLDQCAFGSTLPNDEGVETPIQKRTCLKTTSEELLSMLGRKCPGNHSHQHVIGKTPGGVPRARAAGAYQPGFCSAVAVALDQVFLEGNFTTTEVRELVDHALLDANNVCDEAEEFARLALARNDFSYEVLEKIANRIDLRKHQSARHKKDGKLDTDEFAFIGGLWQFGGKHGITKGTSMYPTVCQYFNAFFCSKGYSGWSSFYLGKNVKTKVHVDCHNMRDTDSVTVSFGQFSGGRLWLADKDGNIPANDVVLKVDRTGKTLPGKYIHTKEKPTVFDARKPHCTEDWSGTRWCLTMYTGRSLQNASNSLKQSLKSFGFPVAQDKPEQDHNQTVRTPKRSARRTLWRNAKRVSALATWSILAASSMSTTGCDNGTKTTALFEWGGMHKTMEAAAGNYYFVEPLQKEDLLEDYGVDLAHQAVRDLRPSTIWIHGGVLRDCVGRLRDVISEQLGSGRRIAIEAQLGDEFWTSQHVEGLGNGCSTRWTRFGDSQVMWLRNTAEDPGGDGQLQEHSAQHGPPGGGEDHHPGHQCPDRLCERRAQHGPLEGGEGQLSGHRQVGSRNAVQEPVVSTQLCPWSVQVADHEPRRDRDGEERRGAKGITFKDGVKPEVASALRRLHQNMGHPDPRELARHLRLAGADASVVAAAKSLSCDTCSRHRRAGHPRPASLPNILSFNQVVGADIFSIYDIHGGRHDILSVIDFSSTFHLCTVIEGHDAISLEKAFVNLWVNVFGAPKTLAVDLETGLQAAFGNISAWFGTQIRPSAGQAHWQQGTTERHGGVWKEMFARVNDEHSTEASEIPLCVAAVNAAKNQMRRVHGYSPSQIVWGRDPGVPGELLGDGNPEQEEHVLSQDQARAREHTIRCAAKAAFFRCQSDQKLRRALLQRSRVAPGSLSVGDIVYFLRKPKNSKDWVWKGPATVIGSEGPNSWVSFAGRCHLCAGEHIRLATGEELGEAFTMRSTRDDLLRLLEGNPDDPGHYFGERLGGPGLGQDNGNEEVPPDPELPAGDVFAPVDDEDVPDYMSDTYKLTDDEGDKARKKNEGSRLPSSVPKRMRTKGPGETLMTKGVHEAFMLRRPTTERGKLKQLEKEIPWSSIPEREKAAFRKAEEVQWQEHLQHQALEPVSIEESKRILRECPERVLPSRFAYKDKAFAKRRLDSNVAWRHKSRLVVGGHLDPDISSGNLQTSAPTVSRAGILSLLQLCASRLKAGWTASAGDVTAAFLNGEPLSRQLFIRQPRCGLGQLHPSQIVRIKKGVFGLVDSPNGWWHKLKKTILDLKVDFGEGKQSVITQCPLDPCIFQVQIIAEDGSLEPPRVYLAVHVDDLLCVGERSDLMIVQDALSSVFPVDDWIMDSFEYVGSQVHVLEDEVVITQEGYAASRLFEVDIDKHQDDDDPARPDQLVDNRSLVGALSWLAGQTRPDLQCGVSMAQQVQKSPTVRDVKFTNQLAKRALEHQQEGVRLRPVPLDDAVILCYHDAGWSNAPQNHEDPHYQLYPQDEHSGIIDEGPFSVRPKKAKRGATSIASQLGVVFLLAPRDVLHGEHRRVSLLDWKSLSCPRVCRSTFAAETMACAHGVEGGMYLCSLLDTLIKGKLVRPQAAKIQTRLLTDCRSLYDHLMKDGIPRAPSDRRLAIDLAAIRQDLPSTSGLSWVPTDLQLADLLTKPRKAQGWWKEVAGGLKLPFTLPKGEENCNQCKSVEVHCTQRPVTPC